MSTAPASVGTTKVPAATVTADGLSDDVARQATLDYLTAVGIPAGDIVTVVITPTTAVVGWIQRALRAPVRARRRLW